MPRVLDSTALGDVTFTAPTGWRRRVLVSFAEPEPDVRASRSANVNVNPSNVVFVREPLPEGETLHSLVEAQLVEMRDLPGFRLVGHRTFERDAMPAVETTCEWVNDEGPIAQTTTLLEAATAEGPLVLSITTTCAKRDADAMRPVFAELLESVRMVRAASVSDIVSLRPFDDASPPPLPLTSAPPRIASVPMPGFRSR